MKLYSFLKIPTASYKNVGFQILVGVGLVCKKGLCQKIQIKISGHIPSKRGNKNQRVFLRRINKREVERTDGRNGFQCS